MLPNDEITSTCAGDVQIDEQSTKDRSRNQHGRQSKSHMMEEKITKYHFRWFENVNKISETAPT